MTLNAIRSIVSEEGFDDLLDSVRGRIDDIESLHRTREVMLKEPIRVRLSSDRLFCGTLTSKSIRD